VTNPENESLADMIDNDRIRYTRKGYGLIFALSLGLGYVLFVPVVLGEKLYSWILTSGLSNDYLYLISSWMLHSGIFIFMNLVMEVIYWVEHPFFERYKTNNYHWPWKANP
jgi:hypothetical protein